MSRLVIVTGGAHGIGRATALAFARAGHRVVVADRDAAAGEALERAVAREDFAAGSSDSTKLQLKFVPADFSRAAACAQVVEAATTWAGGCPVRVLVNNVGVQSDNGKPVHLLTEEEWDTVLGVNLKSYFLMAKHALLSGMLEVNEGMEGGCGGGGAIINIGSVQGQQSQVGIPAYAASKGAIASLTRQMALDYSAHGVRTVCVSPGTIRTPLVETLVEQDGQTCEELGARYPLGRMGDPEDVADLVVFLASDKARNITGVDIACDGGIMAMGSWDQRVGLRRE